MPAWDDYQIEREAWRSQVAENSARLAYAFGRSVTTGIGSLTHEDNVDFGVAFIDQPMFSYGTVLTNQIDFENDAGGAVPMPTSTGFVFSWRQDARGFYIGAHVGVTVTGGVADVELEHHFTFIGTALKDIGSGAQLGYYG